jgi:protein tyrosine phosphatase (PTP) superfamily phosphohydrolase (DUF442 family)
MKSSGLKIRLGRARNWLPVTLILVIGIATGVLIWEQWLKDRYIPKRWRAVEAGSIYRSGQLSAALVHETLAKYGIRMVVDLTGFNPDSPDQQAEVRACETLRIEHRRFPLKGNGLGQLERYANAIASVQRAVAEGKPVLVHCAAGTQRTSGLVAAYRLLVQKGQANEVYAEMIDAGWQPGERQELLHFLNNNMGALAAMLVDRHTIDRLPSPMPRLDATSLVADDQLSNKHGKKSLPLPQAARASAAHRAAM